MTPLKKVYDAFLGRMTDDEWELWTSNEVNEDWRILLDAAIPWFKFPKKSLEIEENNFVSNLNNREIQILATYMKVEWLNRVIMDWKNVRPLYDERDFSQANLIDKFSNLLLQEKKNAKDYESIYYRAIDNKPFPYQKLAGGKDE